MGSGYRYRCSGCQKEYEVFTGIGFMFPQEYSKLFSDMKKGGYGKDIKDLFEKSSDLAIDAEKQYYECEDCGYWKVDQCKDIYKARDDKAHDENDYIMGYDLKHSYKLVYKYENVCPKCKGHMKKRNIRNVACPKCGKANRPLHNVMWD